MRLHCSLSCSCILLKHRRWGMMWRKSQGRYLDPWLELQRPEPFQRTRPASRCLQRNLTCSFQQVSKALKLTCCFMADRGDWPGMSRGGLYQGLDLPRSLPLDIPNSAQTDTHGEQYSVPPTKHCVTLSLHPLLNSKPQQQHWEFRRLLHNCGVSATRHSHQFLKVGTSAIQKGKNFFPGLTSDPGDI